MTDRNISEFMEEKEDGACLTAERPKTYTIDNIHEAFGLKLIEENISINYITKKHTNYRKYLINIEDLGDCYIYIEIQPGKSANFVKCEYSITGTYNIKQWMAINKLSEVIIRLTKHLIDYSKIAPVAYAG